MRPCEAKSEVKARRKGRRGLEVRLAVGVLQFRKVFCKLERILRVVI